MKQGWFDQEHLILFDADEALAATKDYNIQQYLPGAIVIGLRGWDDFIIEMTDQHRHTIPTVPLNKEFLAEFTLKYDPDKLEVDPKHSDMIKWYITPVVFGGDPSIGTNLTWVNHEQHRQLVRWWNAEYFRIKAEQ